MKKTVRLTETDLRNLVKTEVKRALSEDHINAKKRNIDNAIDVFKKGKGGYNHIKTFGIVSAENPDSQGQPRHINKRNMKRMSDSLKSAHYAFVRQKGHFGGNDEWSYYVFNINLKTLAYYAGMYEQTSFIYAELKGNEVISHYYEKQDVNAPYNEKRNPYVLKDTEESYIDGSNAEDYSEIGGKFRYTIPFSIFKNVDEKIEKNLALINEDKEFAIDFGMNRVGMPPLLMREGIYKGLY